jgi:hypothetical protein
MRTAWMICLMFPMMAIADCGLEQERFNTELDAVKALSSCYLARSVQEDREFIAVLFETEDGIKVRISDGEKRTGTASISFPRSLRDDLVALWHTHGAPAPGRNLFSPQDTAIAHQLGVPFYLSDPQGVIRVYQPEGEPPRSRPRLSGNSRLRAPVGSAHGDYVTDTRHHVQG